MATITKEQLLAKDDLKIEQVPGLEPKVFVKQMSAHEHSVYTRMLSSEVPILGGDGKPTGQMKPEMDMEDWPSKLAACTICNEQGDLLLDPQDWKVLAQNKKGAFIDAVATAASGLNKMAGADQEAKVKNSAASRKGSSSSSSPSTAAGPTRT